MLQPPGMAKIERVPVQISRFLVVDPRQRYTAGQALAHPFFQQYDVEEVRHFTPFRRFKVGVRLGAAGAGGGMGFAAELGGTGSWVGLGFGRIWQPGCTHQALAYGEGVKGEG